MINTFRMPASITLLMPTVGSLHGMLRSCSGNQSSVVLHKNPAVSLSTTKPCVNIDKLALAAASHGLIAIFLSGVRIAQRRQWIAALHSQ